MSSSSGPGVDGTRARARSSASASASARGIAVDPPSHYPAMQQRYRGIHDDDGVIGDDDEDVIYPYLDTYPGYLPTINTSSSPSPGASPGANTSSSAPNLSAGILPCSTSQDHKSGMKVVYHAPEDVINRMGFEGDHDMVNMNRTRTRTRTSTLSSYSTELSSVERTQTRARVSTETRARTETGTGQFSTPLRPSMMKSNSSNSSDGGDGGSFRGSESFSGSGSFTSCFPLGDSRSLGGGSGSVDGGGNGTFNGGNGSLGGGSSGPVSGKMARMMRRVSDALTFSNPSSRSSPSAGAGPRPGHSPSASPGAGGGGAGGTGGGGGGVIADHHHGSSSRIESSNRINNGGGSNFDINDRDHYTATNHSHKSDNDHSNNHEKKVAGLLTISHMSASNLVMTAGWGTRKVNPYHTNSPRIDHSHTNSPLSILLHTFYHY